MSTDAPAEAPLPAENVNAENAISRVHECEKYLKEMNWTNFDFLYGKISAFADTVLKGGENDKLLSVWAKFRETAIEDGIANLKAMTSFEDFSLVLRRLSTVVNDPERLWNLLKTNFSSQEATTLRVTLHQTQLLAAEFFTPSQLFEYGFKEFTESSLCEMTHIQNEETLVDIFYAVAGFVLGCNLPQTFVTSLESYCEFIKKMLEAFTALNDFDARRFVWLVQVMNLHLHIHEATLKQICVDVITDYINGNSEKSSFNKLYKLCVISTSPFMKKLDVLKKAITDLTMVVLEEQELFLRKYVFCNFVMCDWTSLGEKRNSDAFKCWKLYVINMAARLQDRSEYPMEILSELIDESLRLFEGYFAEIQPTWRKSANMRMDIFGIVETAAQYYPSEIPDDSLRRMWYLLYIAAVSGAGESEIAACKPAEQDDSDAPFLGLDRTDCEFIDYKSALEKLSKKFESEFDRFQDMAKFIRQNYKRQ